MSPNENLHMAIGELAYAIACSDGLLQKEERQKFYKIVEAELRMKDYAFDVSDIIFRILDKERLMDAQTTYDWAMKEIELNSHYLSPQLKNTFIKVIEKVAKAYPPVTAEEKALIDRFKKDIAPIEGDPVFYAQKH